MVAWVVLVPASVRQLLGTAGAGRRLRLSQAWAAPPGDTGPGCRRTGRLVSVGRRARGRAPDDPSVKQKELESIGKPQQVSIAINEQIKSFEVRVIAELSVDPMAPEMKEMNEVMLTVDALKRARDRGLDLVLVNENADPPIVKIVNVGKYLYDEKKKNKELQANGKAVRMKDVRISYVIGEHDLQTNLRKMEKWLGNSKQQVRVTVVMKGRTRMFRTQAMELLTRILREAAPYGKASGGEKGAAVSKDGKGDLYVLISHGPDIKLLKEMKAEAESSGTYVYKPLQDVGDEDTDDVDGEGEGDGEELTEIEALEAQIEEMRQELIDSGIKPNKVNAQEEMKDLMTELRKLQGDPSQKDT